MQTYIREALSAANDLALVRLLSRVRPNVDSQSTPLNKSLAAVLPVALERPLIGVNSVVTLQVGFPVEALRISVLAEFFIVAKQRKSS